MKRIFLALAITLACIQNITATNEDEELWFKQLFCAVEMNRVDFAHTIIKNFTKESDFQRIIHHEYFDKDYYEYFDNDYKEYLPSILAHTLHKKHSDITKIIIQHAVSLNKNKSLNTKMLLTILKCADREIIDYLISKKSFTISQETFLEILDEINHTKGKVYFSFFYLDFLKKFMNPERTSIENLKSLKKNISYDKRYKSFKYTILHPSEPEHLDGFDNTQQLQMIPLLFLQQRSNCCDYDINFYFNNN